MVPLALCSMVDTPSARHGEDARRNPAPVRQRLVPRSFLWDDYVLARELIPLAACFPPAPMLPSEAARGRPRGMPRAGDPLASRGCRW